jgi:hypothetical protein
MAKVFTIKEVKCIRPSAGIDRTALDLSTGFVTAAGSIAAAGGAVVTGPAVVAVAGIGVSIAAQLSQKAVPALARSFAGSDELYIKVNGRKIWPGGKYVTIGSQQTHAVNFSADLTGDVNISLYEYDKMSSDDYMGCYIVKPDHSIGTHMPVIDHPPEGSIYMLAVEVNEKG